MANKVKNNISWRDIVKIKGNYYLEEFDVEFEDVKLNDVKLPDNESEILKKLEEFEKQGVCTNPLYDCSNFFAELAAKYSLSEEEMEDVETYLFDDIDLPKEACEEFDIAWLGGYVNGVNI